jgi:hypothetical protein
MKIVKHILVLSAVTFGLSASAQMHESKQESVKDARKVSTNEKPKAMPETKIKAESNTSTSVQNEQKTEKQTTTTTTNENKSNVNSNSTQQTGGDQGTQIKQIKRPIKPRAVPKKLEEQPKK